MTIFFLTNFITLLIKINIEFFKTQIIFNNVYFSLYLLNHKLKNMHAYV